MKLVITNNFETPEKISDFLIKFSREIMKLFNNEPVQYLTPPDIIGSPSLPGPM
jgi:hypothetical protein